MLVSNRILTAALSALQSQLAAQYEAVNDNPIGRDSVWEYHGAIQNLKAALRAHGEDLVVKSAKIKLPGES
nr:hypothetical protein 37 [bacterium]